MLHDLTEEGMMLHDLSEGMMLHDLSEGDDAT